MLLLLLLPFSLLNASKILSYNIYDRTDRVDVMITFDTPYDGVIKQSISPSSILIKLNGASIESAKSKNISSKFLRSIAITPMSGQTQILASVPSSVKLLASKTSDSYGLRLRFLTKTPIVNDTTNKEELEEENANTLSMLPTKQTNDMSSSYYIVVSVLIIGILILFMIKKKLVMKNSQTSAKNLPWQFKETKQVSNNAQNAEGSNHKQIAIRFQKAIDERNSVVMLDFGEQSYLVLIGNSNILLDKFKDDKPSTEEDFESILQNRHLELEKFLKVQPSDNNNSFFSLPSNDPTEALKAYKERAASMAYDS